MKRARRRPLCMKCLTPGVLVLTLLVAGCLQSTDAPIGGTPTSTPTPSTVPTTPSAPPGGPAGGMLIRPVHNESETSGFFLEGDESVSGFIPPADVTFTFHAANRGAAAEAISDPCGAGNPRVAIYDENGTKLDLTGPRMRCMAAISWQPWAQGGELWMNLTWNGTVYHGENASRAPPGKYTAIATLQARRGGTETDVKVGVPVNLLDESARGAL